MNRARQSVLVLLVGACLALTPLRAGAEPSSSDRETVRALLADGSAKLAAKDFQGALSRFRAARDVMKSPATGVHVALAEEAMGLLIEARESALEVIGLPESAPREPKPEEQARAAAKELAAKLDMRIPSLVVSVKTPAEATALRALVDGKPIPSSMLGLPRKVNPGTYDVEASATGYVGMRRRVIVKEGESIHVALALTAVAMGETPKPQDQKSVADQAPPPRSHVGPILAFGAGAIGLCIGVSLGASVLRRRSELVKACPYNACPESEQGALDVAKTLSHVSTAALVVAGAATTLGIVLVALPARGSEKTKKVGIRLGAGYAGVEGTF